MSVRLLGGIGGAALQLKPYRTAARSNPVAGRYNRVTYCAVPSPGGSAREPKMEQEKQPRPQAEHDESKHTDVMTDSFGEGYGTRSDEEGFGGIYGGNDPVLNPGPHVNHPDYDKSQGSEVKEKEKARNLKPGAHTT